MLDVGVVHMLLDEGCQHLGDVAADEEAAVGIDLLRRAPTLVKDDELASAPGRRHILVVDGPCDGPVDVLCR